MLKIILLLFFQIIVVCPAIVYSQCGFKPSDSNVLFGSNKYPDLGNEFSVFSTNDKDAVINVPFSYLDNVVSSQARPFTSHASAASVIKTMNLAKSFNTADELLSSPYFIGAKEIRTGAGDMQTEFRFRLANKRVAHVFSYFNDLFGMVSVIKVCPN